MMSLIRTLFPGKPKVEHPDEPQSVIEERELKKRLIEEHREANERGRQLLEDRSLKERLRYKAALDEAMNIMGSR